MNDTSSRGGLGPRGREALIPTSPGTSPFDAIRRTRPDGGEYWSARDLMPLLGYSKWERFVGAIERAEVTATNQGQEHTISRLREMVPQGGAERIDYQLSRFGAYLVAMNGDPRKPEVAAAQAYFAIRARQAEIAPPAFDPATLTRTEILVMALNAETERMALEAKNAELEPKAEAYENFLDATGHYSVGAVAKMLGTSQNRLFRDLRNAGVLIAKGAMRNTPYQQYMRYFVVKAHEYERSNGDPGCSYTTYVQPAGIDFIRRKLDLPSIDPQLPMGGAA